MESKERGNVQENRSIGEPVVPTGWNKTVPAAWGQAALLNFSLLTIHFSLNTFPADSADSEDSGVRGVRGRFPALNVGKFPHTSLDQNLPNLQNLPEHTNRRFHGLRGAGRPDRLRPRGKRIPR